MADFYLLQSDVLRNCRSCGREKSLAPCGKFIRENRDRFNAHAFIRNEEDTLVIFSWSDSELEVIADVEDVFCMAKNVRIELSNGGIGCGLLGIRVLTLGFGDVKESSNRYWIVSNQH